MRDRAQDIQAVAQAQVALREKTEEVAAADGRRRWRSSGAAAAHARGLTRPGDDPLPRAVEAMGRAAGELDRLSVAAALPHEEQALAELLKAAAEIRRRQVADAAGARRRRQRQPQSARLSTLFDQELRKQQQTNYESRAPRRRTTQQKQAEDDPLAGDSRAGAPAGGLVAASSATSRRTRSS